MAKDVRERRSEAQLLEDIVAAEEKLKVYRARLQKRRAQDKVRERKQRSHALVVFGGMVESHIIGGWKNIDPDALDAYLNQYERALRERVTKDLPCDDTAEANAAVRDFERRQREAKMQARRSSETTEAPRFEDTQEVMF